jgi:hypothetical protein
MLGTYCWNILIAIDQFFNAVLGGDPDETISSRMGRWRSMGGWRAKIATSICLVLHVFDRGHCYDAIEEDHHHERDIIDN